MEHQTFRFEREQITTPFIREPVDVDDTVPVALYTRPYERIDIQADSSPYERIEISHARPAPKAPAPSRFYQLARALFFVSIHCLAFALGIAFAVLVL